MHKVLSTSLRISIALLLLVCCGAGENTKLDSILDMQDFVQDWKQSKQFTLDVANAMPAEFYNFKPSPDEMTFGEQMAHIAGGNVFRLHQITGIQPPFGFDPSKPAATDKRSVLKMLDLSFDYVIVVLAKITSEQLNTSNVPLPSVEFA